MYIISVRNLLIIYLQKIYIQFSCIYINIAIYKILILFQGEYRIIFEKVHLCESIKNQSILANVYFDKKTPSENVLRGNLTLLIPFDDTLTVSTLRLVKKLQHKIHLNFRIKVFQATKI